MVRLDWRTRDPSGYPPPSLIHGYLTQLRGLLTLNPHLRHRGRKEVRKARHYRQFQREMREREREYERDRRDHRRRRESRREERERAIEVAMNGDRVVPIEVARTYSNGHGRNVLRRNSGRARGYGGQEVIEIVRSHAGSHRPSERTHYSNSGQSRSYSRSRSRHRRSGIGGFFSRLFGSSRRSSSAYNRPRSSSHRRSSTPFLHPHRCSRPVEYGLGTYLRGLFTRNRVLCEQGKMMMEEGARERRRERRRRLRRLREESMAVRMGATTVQRGHREGRGHGQASEYDYGRDYEHGRGHSHSHSHSESRYGRDGMTRRVGGMQRIVVD